MKMFFLYLMDYLSGKKYPTERHEEWCDLCKNAFHAGHVQKGR